MLENIRLAKAGLEPQKRLIKRTVVQKIDTSESKHHHHEEGLRILTQPVIDKEDVLSEYVPSPVQRVITEYELLGALISNKDLSESEKKKQNEEINRLKYQVAFAGVLNSQNYAKQFGADKCESLSKLSKIVGHQYVSLNGKYQRIKSKQKAFEYKKPDSPINHYKNLEKVEK